jgi:hypothetical protein
MRERIAPKNVPRKADMDTADFENSTLRERIVEHVFVGQFDPRTMKLQIQTAVKSAPRSATSLPPAGFTFYWRRTLRN